MRGLLLSVEVLAAVCALVIVVIVVLLSVTFARRRTIARGAPLTLCAIRRADETRWRLGFARYGSNALDWFSLGGMSLRATHHWDRQRLEIGSVPQSLTAHDRSLVLMPEAVCVTCRHGLCAFDLALPPGPYTALRSWLEASPPGFNVNVA